MMRGKISPLRQARKLSPYLIIPALSAVSPLIAVPAITSRYGADGWTTVAVSISIGATASTVSDLGWGIIGPQEIARQPNAVTQIYDRSLGSKWAAMTIAVPLSAALAVWLSNGDWVDSAVIAVGTLLSVISPSWLFVGLGRPSLILKTDTVPRLILSTGAAISIASGAPLVVYALSIPTCAIVTYVYGSVAGELPIVPSWKSLKAGPRTIRDQAPLIFGNVVSTVFTSAPAAILAQANAASLITTFTAVDRPMRMGLTVLAGVPARLQSWVGVPDLAEARRRSQLSIAINVGLGVIAMLGFVLIAPTFSRYFFSGTVDVGTVLSILGGILAAEICSSRGLGLALVSAGRASVISVGTTAGAVVGIALLLTLPHVWGPEGAVVALIAAEGVMIAVQIAYLYSAWRSEALGGRTTRTISS